MKKGDLDACDEDGLLGILVGYFSLDEPDSSLLGWGVGSSSKVWDPDCFYAV